MYLFKQAEHVVRHPEINLNHPPNLKFHSQQTWNCSITWNWIWVCVCKHTELQPITLFYWSSQLSQFPQHSWAHTGTRRCLYKECAMQEKKSPLYNMCLPIYILVPGLCLKGHRYEELALVTEMLGEIKRSKLLDLCAQCWLGAVQPNRKSPARSLKGRICAVHTKLHILPF